MAEMQMYNRKIRDMENENNEFRDKVMEGQDELQKAKNYAKELERQGKNLERTVNELGRKSNLQEEEMKELRGLYDDERRKTMANERTASQLAAENKNLQNQLRDIARDFEDSKNVIEDLEEKIEKAGSIISALERHNEELKRNISELEGETERAEGQAREVPRLRSKLGDLERTAGEKDAEARRLNDLLRKKDYELQEHVKSLQSLEN